MSAFRHPGGPDIAGALAALAVVVSLWVSPALAPPLELETRAGETHAETWSVDRPHRLVRSWEHTFYAADGLPRHALVPAVDYSFSSCVPASRIGESGAGVVAAAFQTFVNGVSVHEEVVRHEYRFGYGSSPSCGSTTKGLAGPQPEDLDAVRELVMEGENRITVQLVLQLDRTRGGWGNVLYTTGPLRVRVVELDGDGDGVPDARQPVPGAHTGLVAAALGTLVGAGTSHVVALVGRTPPSAPDAASPKKKAPLRDSWRTR